MTLLLDRASGFHSLLGLHTPAANLAWECPFHVRRAASHRGELILHGVLLGLGWVLLGHDSSAGRLQIGTAAPTA